MLRQVLFHFVMKRIFQGLNFHAKPQREDFVKTHKGGQG